MTENLPILTGKTLSLISLFELYMRLLDSISILNSRCGIARSKHVHPVLFHCDGLILQVPLLDYDKFKVALIESRYNKYSDEQDKSIVPIVNFVNVSNHE